MSGIKYFGAALLAGAVLVGCGKVPPSITGCDAMGELEPLCVFQNPEDIVALPNQGLLLVSQMGKMDGSIPGSLVYYRPETGALHRLFPDSDWQVMKQEWGSPDCPGEPGAEFSPHGMDVITRPDGKRELLVINHGQRESVEYFQLAINEREVALVWQGCVMLPPGTFLNDVAALPDGGFVASHMFDKNAPLLMGISTGMLRAMVGFDTGYLVEWTPSAGVRQIPGSEGALPNGVAVDSKGEWIYEAVYYGVEVRKLKRATGEVAGSARVLRPDNLSWAGDRLLIASNTGTLPELRSCNDNFGKACPAAFRIVALNPQTMKTATVLEHRGEPMGAATVAVTLNGALFMGSFTGDRILSVALEGAMPALPAESPSAPAR